MKQNHRICYYNLLTVGTLSQHFVEIDGQSERIFRSLVKSLPKKENVTERLKIIAPMEWIQKRNHIPKRAIEIVNAKMVFV